jgi:hypothetical protein
MRRLQSEYRDDLPQLSRKAWPLAGKSIIASRDIEIRPPDKTSDQIRV